MHSTSPQRRAAALRLDNPGDRQPPRRRSGLIGAALIVGTIAIGAALVATGSVPLSSKTVTAAPVIRSDVTVDFGVQTATDDSAAIGVDESTYGTPSDINDPKAQALLKKLGVGYARIALTLANPADPASRITCAANGCNTQIDPIGWVRMMESVGETPVAEIPDTLSPAAAAAIVTHLNGTGGASLPVLYWVIGNEPNASGESASTYDAHFNTMQAAMKQADPQIEIGGPATYGFDQSFLQQFLRDCGSRADFVDFHFYQAPGHQTAAQLLAELPAMSRDLATLRAMIKATVPDRASAIAIHVGEWNFSADPDTLAQYAFSGFASVLDADLLGRILAAGADGLAWGSKNATLSLLYGAVYPGDVAAPAGYKSDTPMPLYQAIAMFTGQGRFPRFGTTIVSATSVLPGVDVFASASPDEIVIVNTSARSERVTVRVNGDTPHSAAVWQLHQTTPVAKPPVKKGNATSEAGIFKLYLPADSVTTMVMTTLANQQK
jgi:glycosyl hydrolase family 39 (putative alpha-L-iduronidase)